MIGEKLKRFRKENKLTQQQVASKLKIGRTTVSEIEHDNRKESLTLIKKLSEYSGKPVSYWMEANNKIDTDIGNTDNVNDVVLLRELLNMLHYKKLDNVVKVKIGDTLYDINFVSENYKNNVYINVKENKG